MVKHSYVVAAMVVVTVITTSQASTPNELCQCARLQPLCIQMVHGATNYKDALKNAFESTLVLNRMTPARLVPVVTSVVQKTNSPSSKKILKTCLEKVNDVTTYIRDLITAVDEDNKDFIEYYLRTGELTLRDCVDSITEINMPVPPELSKLAKDVEDYKETTLVIFLQAPVESVYNKPMPVDYAG